MATTKFKKLSIAQFVRKHDEAQEALEAEDIPQTLPRTFGEVKIPGYGWHPCILNDKGVPSHFYSDDDGWQECPKATFEEMK